LKLLAGRRGDRRAPAATAKLAVNPSVRFAGAVVGRRDEGVELAAQLAELAMHGEWPRYPRRRILGLGVKQRPLSELLVLASVQQGAHLVGRPGIPR